MHSNKLLGSLCMWNYVKWINPRTHVSARLLSWYIDYFVTVGLLRYLLLHFWKAIFRYFMRLHSGFSMPMYPLSSSFDIELVNMCARVCMQWILIFQCARMALFVHLISYISPLLCACGYSQVMRSQKLHMCVCVCQLKVFIFLAAHFVSVLQTWIWPTRGFM